MPDAFLPLLTLALGAEAQHATYLNSGTEMEGKIGRQAAYLPRLLTV